MPCFKGLAVSIHTPDGPIPEYSIQKQTKVHRITSYIPVPKPRISAVGTAEQSTFAISITLLTPGLSVPYSTPKATPDNPYPRAQIVGHTPRPGERGSITGAAQPYAPLTASENETIAAYIYFDGRNKEEVATLLRRGEETWVNSRWVGVSETEGGGLAEREFLFKEVGLERWLNGLDLAGSKDAAEMVQRRKERLEKKRRKRAIKKEESDNEDAANPSKWIRKAKKADVLRYGDGDVPLEKLSDDDHSSEEDNDSDSDDDDPLPESAGQIKVALFRVLASGEIKKGEYSPQFKADDDDEDQMRDESGEGEEIDHATSFAKPKTLDPKSISTQTVTGIDPPDKPYAVFTFLYRGEKQLQKMGILKPKKAPSTDKDAKRKSVQETVKSLGALKAGAAERFTNIRDSSSASNSKKKVDDDDMSDEDEEERSARDKKEDDDDYAARPKRLDPEDAQRTEKLLSGVQKMRLKRQHSFEPPSLTPDPSMLSSGQVSPTKDGNSATPPNTASAADASTTPLLPSATYNPLTDLKADASLDKSMIGSPMKKARASLSAEEDSVRKARAEALAKGLGFGFGTDTEGGNSTAPEIIFGGSIGSSGADKSGTESTTSKLPAGSADQGMDEEL